MEKNDSLRGKCQAFPFLEEQWGQSPPGSSAPCGDRFGQVLCPG